MIAAATQSMTRQNGGHHRVLANKLASVLPEILEPMARQSEDEQPGRFRDGGGSYQDEHCREACLEADYDPAPIGDREADVDRRDEYQTEGVNRGGVEPPEGER
jgi:hypothetical protein